MTWLDKTGHVDHVQHRLGKGEEFHKEKVRSKKENAPKSSLCTAAPSTQTKSVGPLSDCLFVYFLREKYGQRLIFIN